GHGRKSHTPAGENAAATRLVGLWLRDKPDAMQYWDAQVREVRQWASTTVDVREKRISPERLAAAELGKRLRKELVPQVAAEAKGVQQDLLFEVLQEVNWTELAEDLLAR